MTLVLYDTRRRRKVAFTPGSTPATMYLCGMTPKAPPHMGHARLFVVADVFRRYLAWRDLPLTFVQNFTDVDDKIIERARGTDEDPFAYAQRMTAAYFHAMDELNVQRADHYPRVTEHIEAIITVIRGLLDRDTAYIVGGDVYFSVDAFPAYGQFSGRVDDGVEAGRRVEVDAQKRNPRDFVLWKAAVVGEPSWESPWGPGRPGWHIECTSMVFKLLGPQVDLHVGGADLIFPHHENEIAQSEAYTGKSPFARHWLHVGLLMAGREKMAHSLNNYTTISNILEEYPAEAIRLYLLSVHYRSPMTFAPENIDAQRKGLDRLISAVERQSVGSAIAKNPDLDEAIVKSRRRFVQAMDDDLNTAVAVSVIYDLARDINRSSADCSSSLSQARDTLKELAGVLGIDILTVAKHLGSRELGRAQPFLNLLLDMRRFLRNDGLYELADMIRDRLADEGITIEDQADETVWRQSSPTTALAPPPMISLLLKVRQGLRSKAKFELADSVRDQLSKLGVTVEDRPDGSFWR